MPAIRQRWRKARQAELTEASRDVAGAADVNWQYRQADIYLNLEKLFSLTDQEIDYTIRHEIGHLLVNEMKEWEHGNANRQAINHEERVVTDLAMILGWVRTAGKDEATPKKRRKK